MVCMQMQIFTYNFCVLLTFAILIKFRHQIACRTCATFSFSQNEARTLKRLHYTKVWMCLFVCI